MCLLAIQYQTIPGAPVCVAANREEFFDRAALPPAIQPGTPRVLCGTDRRAGGTWLGVNQYGVLVAVTNRSKSRVPAHPRSRGLLCRDLLNCSTAAEASEKAQAELKSDRYAGVNLIFADAANACVIHSHDRLDVQPLSPGLHIITNGDLNDPADPRVALARFLFNHYEVASAAQFILAAKTVVSLRADTPSALTIVLRRPDRGTVSSTLLALTDNPTQAQYHHSPGPPDRCEFVDYSPLLREILRWNLPRRLR